MSDRQELLRRFIDTTDWVGAIDRPLAGDASNRSYRRLIHPETGETAVLMDAPRTRGEDVRPFIRVAEYLSGLGLSAPRIWAADVSNGFLLIEDLGDDLYARILARRGAKEAELYEAATDVLVHLHKAAPPDGVPVYDQTVMTNLATLVFDWYVDGISGPMPTARDAFAMQMSAALEVHAPEADILIQRDYHAENLLWLPERDGVARVGLLDFQDGARGHRAYDLVSLLQDARRDVSPEIERAMIDRYTQATGQDPEQFERAYHVLGVQRNLRVLGVFARLSLRDKKTHYVDLIPRVWAHLRRDLDYPDLHSLRDILLPVLPEPTDGSMEKLRNSCVTALAQ